VNDESSRKAGAKNIGGSSFAARDTNLEIPELYEFGPFRLDPGERKLLRENEVISLTPKAFDVLVLLVRNSGHLLEKEELIRTLWPDSFVEEGNLTNSIFMLRKALGENTDYIETVPKKGYRFVGAVRQLPDGAESAVDRHTREKRLVVAAMPASAWRSTRILAVIILTVFSVLGAGRVLWWSSSIRVPDRSQWVPLTKLPDSASQPVLSPDGRLLAFVRGPSTWIGPGQIYVKFMPDGEPVQLTHDDLIKSDPAFSPVGSRITYTVLDPQHFTWDTWGVPTLRGEPQLMMRNASGLSWTGPHQVLFSEIKKGIHMGIVAADENRLGARDIYLPTDEPAMAHRSYLSPNGKWVLLAEMDQDHQWLPCRVVPTDGNSIGRLVGPLARSCMSAAWSRDSKWMYFTANPGGVNHIWRQRFPDGQP